MIVHRLRHIYPSDYLVRQLFQQTICRKMLFKTKAHKENFFFILSFLVVWIWSAVRDTKKALSEWKKRKQSNMKLKGKRSESNTNSCHILFFRFRIHVVLLEKNCFISCFFFCFIFLFRIEGNFVFEQYHMFGSLLWNQQCDIEYVQSNSWRTYAKSTTV